MSEKRVLIVSSNALFREGLSNVLADRADPSCTTQTSSIQEADELAQEGKVDVIIIDRALDVEEQTDQYQFVSRLLSFPEVRVITVSLVTDDLWIYKQERVETASVEALVAAIDG